MYTEWQKLHCTITSNSYSSTTPRVFCEPWPLSVLIFSKKASLGLEVINMGPLHIDRQREGLGSWGLRSSPSLGTRILFRRRWFLVVIKQWKGINMILGHGWWRGAEERSNMKSTIWRVPSGILRRGGKK